MNESKAKGKMMRKGKKKRESFAFLIPENGFQA